MSFAKLPAELLVIVFKDYISTEGHVKFLKNVVPVCRSWKDIGLTFPSLCKVIDIDGVKEGTQRYLPELELASVKWGLPVTTELRITDVWLNQRVSEVLFLGCPNLRSLSLSNSRVHATTFALVAQHCKKLDSLALDSVNQNGTTISRTTLDPIFLQSGRNLKFVSMSNPMFLDNNRDCGDIVATVVDSCPRLEELKISIPSNKTRRRRLYLDRPEFPAEKLRTSCPNLRVLSVEGYRFRDVYTAWKTKALRNLEQLELISVENTDYVFNVLRNAEQLKQLTMKDVHFYHMDEFAVHRNVGSKSLEKLHLVDAILDPSDLEELLKKLRQSLKEFTVVGKRFFSSDEFLLALLRGNEDPVYKLCMNQEQESSLEVLNLSVPRVRVSVLARVVRQCKRLRALDTTNCSHLPEAYRGKFDAIEEINLLRDSLPIQRVTDDDSDSESFEQLRERLFLWF